MTYAIKNCIITLKIATGDQKPKIKKIKRFFNKTRPSKWKKNALYIAPWYFLKEGKWILKLLKKGYFY